MEDRRITGDMNLTEHASQRPVRRTAQDPGSRQARPDESRRRPRPEGEERRVRPEGVNRRPRPEGEERRVRPEGAKRRSRPEDEERRIRPDSVNRRPRPAQDIPERRTTVRSKRRRRKKALQIQIIFCLVLLIAIVGGTLFWIKYGPTKDTYDMNKYFAIGGEGQMGLTVDDEVLEAYAMKYGDEVYLPYEIVRDHINQRFYWDPNENILLYTLPREMVRIDVGSNSYTLSNQTVDEDYTILKTEGNTAYIAVDFIQKYTAMEYRTYDNPDRIVVDTLDQVTEATVKSSSQVRVLAGVKSPVLGEIKRGDTVHVLDTVDKWKKVRTQDGLIGYTKSSALKKEQEKTITRDFTEEEFTSIKSDHKINLAWHQVTSQSANNSILQTIANTKGLTTLSPTWFSVTDNSGNISSLANSEYVNYAHQSGIDVWALVDNFNENVDSFELLSHTKSRENLENQLVSEALKSGIDGINVDFEKISAETGEHYIQFIRELSIKCRLNGLVLSVDNYVPKGYNSHYHRKEQGIVADYVIIMGYDEHFSGSYEAGSVASYDYVKNGIEETLKEVPADKVINAMPFYTRLWKEVPKTEEELAEQAGTEAADYPMNVTSEAMGMEKAAQVVSDAGVTPVWDDTTQQYYAEWTDESGAVNKIWLEEQYSLEAKLKLMKENKLAGTAGWKLGFETSDTWELILKYVN